MAYFTQHDVPKVHTRCHVLQNFFFLKAEEHPATWTDHGMLHPCSVVGTLVICTS